MHLLGETRDDQGTPKPGFEPGEVRKWGNSDSVLFLTRYQTQGERQALGSAPFTQ
jgi:hypothetical protein